MIDDFEATDLLRRGVDDVPHSTPPVAALLDGGRRLKRRRNSARTLLAGAIAITAVAAVVATVALPRGTEPHHDAEPAAGRLPNPSMTVQEVYEWARGLPMGGVADVSYVVDYRTVVNASHSIELPKGTQVELTGVLTGGWLARLGGTDEQGNWIDIRTGFLSTGGEFRAFHIPARGTPSYHAMGSAISPDRTQVAYDGWIVDVASGDPVAPLPGRPWVIQGWTDEGVEYADRQHGCCTSYLWQPGHPRLELPGVDEVHLGVFDLDAPPIAVKYGTSCSRYFRIEDAARLVFVARLCNEGLAAVSISGLMVTSTGRVLDAQGHQIAHLDIPVPTQRDGFGDRGCCSLYWEADNLLVAVERGGAFGSAGPTLLVRCRLDESAVSGLTCERASKPIDDTTWAYLQGTPTS
jgi:hypothetical protein